MASQFGSFNRSPLGGFKQSPLGARGQARNLGAFIHIAAPGVDIDTSPTGAVWNSATNTGALNRTQVMLTTGRLILAGSYSEFPYTSQTSMSGWPGGSQRRIFALPNGDLATFSSSGLFYSTDSGASWTSIAIPDPSTGPVAGTKQAIRWAQGTDGTIYVLCHNVTGVAGSRRTWVFSCSSAPTVTPGPAFNTPTNPATSSIWCEGNAVFVAYNTDVYEDTGGLTFSVLRSVGSTILLNRNGFQTSKGYLLIASDDDYYYTATGFSVGNGTNVTGYAGLMFDVNENIYAYDTTIGNPYKSTDYLNYTLLDGSYALSIPALLGNSSITRKFQMMR